MLIFINGLNQIVFSIETIETTIKSCKLFLYRCSFFSANVKFRFYVNTLFENRYRADATIRRFEVIANALGIVLLYKDV